MDPHRRLWSDTFLKAVLGAALLTLAAGLGHRVFRHYVPLQHGKTIEEWCRVLRDGHADPRDRADTFLQQFGAPRGDAVPILLTALERTRGAEANAAAAAALVALGPEADSAVVPLLQSLTNP